MRKLSEVKREDGYAKCGNCGETFIDDIGMYGSLMCPNKKCAGYCVERGIKRPKGSKELWKVIKDTLEFTQEISDETKAHEMEQIIGRWFIKRIDTIEGWTSISKDQVKRAINYEDKP